MLNILLYQEKVIHGKLINLIMKVFIKQPKVKLNQLFEKELQINQDLNSDGVLGNAISIAYQPDGGKNII